MNWFAFLQNVTNSALFYATFVSKQIWFLQFFSVFLSLSVTAYYELSLAAHTLYLQGVHYQNRISCALGRKLVNKVNILRRWYQRGLENVQNLFQIYGFVSLQVKQGIVDRRLRI